MANAPFAKLSLAITGSDALSQGLRAGVIPIPIQQVLDLKNGVNDGQIDLLYYKQEQGIAASTTTSYDLAGSLTDIAGTTITFAEIALIYVYNRRTTALSWLKVGPHATVNGFGVLDSPTSGKGFWLAAADKDVVGPSSFLLKYDKTGVPVVGGAQDVLIVITSGVAVTGSTNDYDILILGRSS